MQNRVFIATSLDGYIADSAGGIGFLYAYPDPVDEDMGYHDFIKGVDAILMGRRTYETVIGFGIEWPYKLPVYVWTSTLSAPAPEIEGQVQLVTGDTRRVLDRLHGDGHRRLYIDGGQVIQAFLSEDLVDEMIITTVPILLGSGTRLFGDAGGRLKFGCREARAFSNGLGQYRFAREREAE